MSLIFDALQKLDREKQTPERGVVVVGQTQWGSPESRRTPAAAAALGLVVVGLAAAVWLLTPRDAQAPAPAPAPERPLVPTTPPVSAPAPAPPAPMAVVTQPLVERPIRPEPEIASTVTVPPQPAIAPTPSPVSTPTPAPPPARRFILQAISQREGRPVAMLNDRLVREGDRFDGVQVIRIGEDEIEIEVDGKRRVIGF